MGLRLRSDLLVAGHTPDEIQRLRRSGTLVNVRRGAYVGGTDPRLRDAAATHRLRVEAAVRRLGPGAVVSHVSAAVLHGLPVWGLPLERVHVTHDRRSGARRGRDLQVHAATLADYDITLVAGIAVTSPARTVVDIARRSPFEVAVTVTDAALARLDRERPPLTTPAELTAALEQSARRPGTPSARRAIAFANGLAESVGESRSRVAMAHIGLPRPDLQVEVVTAAGLFLGRVDFMWRWARVVGEFDGKVKYGRSQDAGRTVYEEKLREDAIRDEGYRVVRWTWADLAAFDEVAARLRRALRMP